MGVNYEELYDDRNTCEPLEEEILERWASIMKNYMTIVTLVNR